MFKKLVCSDNWGVYEYASKDDPKTLLNDRLAQLENKRVKVKFPNGALRELPLLAFPRTNRITDVLGDEFAIDTREYFLKASYEGIKVLIPIEEVYVNV